MPGTAAKQPSPRRVANWNVVALALIVAVVVAALAVSASIISRSADAESAARQSVDVKRQEAGSATGWRVPDRATLVSRGRHTEIRTLLVRTSDATGTPALIGDFDGSGGGEPEIVTCAAPAEDWTVSIDGTQPVAMSCDTYVEPLAVHRLRFVYVDAGQ